MATNTVTDLVVNQYIRQPVPQNPEGMAVYLSGQLQEIENSMKTVGEGSLQVVDSPPARPLKGMLRYAVSPWDPLSNGFQGLVVYSGNAWLRASDPDGTVSSLSTTVSSLNADNTANATAISSLNTSVATINGTLTSQASSVTNLTSQVNANVSNIGLNVTTTNGIQSKFGVKIDNNGHVSGFGLISTANLSSSSNPVTSTFNISADAFKIGSPSSSSTVNPFQVYTSSRTVDGVTVPAGTYIENALITSASIKTLDVDVINIDNVTLDTLNGNLIVKSGGIDTSQIAAAAATVMAGAHTASSTQTFGTSDTDIVTLAFNTSDTFDILLSSSVDVTNSSGSAKGILFSIQDSADVIRAQQVIDLANGAETHISLSGFGTTVNGSNSFSLSAQVVGGGTLDFDHLTFQALLRKR